MREVYLRASLGTHALLGLKEIRMSAPITTLYFMLGRRCLSNCAYCSQSGGRGGDYLSRVLWPRIDLKEAGKRVRKLASGGMETAPMGGGNVGDVPEFRSYENRGEKKVVRRLGEGVRGRVERLCIQTLDYPELMEDLEEIAPHLFGHLPTSLSIPPLPPGDLRRLKELGVGMATVSLDAATEEIFYKYRGGGVGNRYTWEGMWRSLRELKKIFGTAVTHVIVGLGESDEALLDLFLKLREEGVYASLFSFTPLPGTLLEARPPPSVGRYRAIQALHYHIFHLGGGVEGVKIVDGRLVEIRSRRLFEALREGTPFRTTGCPGCNRPFYNERPRGPLYNYPHPPEPAEVQRAMKEMKEYGVSVLDG